MSKFLKVLVGFAAVGVTVVGAAAAVKAVCNGKRDKYASLDDAEEFVRFVATPEGDESVFVNYENKE